MNSPVSRRRLVQAASASLLVAGMPALRAQEAARRFDPKPSDWRAFDVVTTVQLADGTLVTSYSYRGNDDEPHLEVVRWRL